MQFARGDPRERRGLEISCMQTPGPPPGRLRPHGQAAAPASFRERRPASSAWEREVTECGNRGEEAWLNNGERGTVAATSTISSSAELRLRDELLLALLNGEGKRGYGISGECQDR
jgi:hypothetical protein